MAISFDKVVGRTTLQTWTGATNGPSATQAFRIIGLSVGSGWSEADQYGGDNWTQNDYDALVGTRSNGPDLVVRPGSMLPSSYVVNVSGADATNIYVLIEVIT